MAKNEDIDPGVRAFLALQGKYPFRVRYTCAPDKRGKAGVWAVDADDAVKLAREMCGDPESFCLVEVKAD